MMRKIIFHDTHVYPGCLVTIQESSGQRGVAIPVVAEFSDGATATANFEPVNQGELLVWVDAYTTARGTRIVPKAWRLRQNEGAGAWKVVAKI